MDVRTVSFGEDYLHLVWEYTLQDVRQTFASRILDGRREHKASLANMAPTPEDENETQRKSMSGHCNLIRNLQLL